MADHEITAHFVVKAGAGVGAPRPSYAEQVAAEDAVLAAIRAIPLEDHIQLILDNDTRAQVERMADDARLYGTGFVKVARQEDGQIIVEHVPLAEVHAQLAEGERQAQEVVITARLDACSSLDHDETRRGKVSRLDGQGTVGEVSKLDRGD